MKIKVRLDRVVQKIPRFPGWREYVSECVLPDRKLQGVHYELLNDTGYTFQFLSDVSCAYIHCLFPYGIQQCDNDLFLPFQCVDLTYQGYESGNGDPEYSGCQGNKPKAKEYLRCPLKRL